MFVKPSTYPLASSNEAVRPVRCFPHFLFEKWAVEFVFQDTAI
ncbi:hypothetical protein MtrunA17_Chr1g0166621 [Medicago truncatula]|uniref:Uncharacterized protein n=1 Tax=Medicago truncatula TaxID=3880 RepID=A0A396JJX2_MEDTR|nr:hypothetical protein MtrunA17_Chr1g0166621 [Medicago truncatula]